MKLTKKLLSLFLILAVLFSVSCSKKAACGEFSLTSPQNQATQVSLTPTLEWTKSANAINYTVTLSTKEDFSEGVIKQDNIKELKWTATALEQETKYYWKVIAHGEGKSKESTQVFSFTTLSTVLGEFGLISPSENAIGVERKPVLEWEACANAVKYSLLISKDEDFTEANTITKENISNTYASPDVTLHGLTTYYWKVIAVGADTDDNTKTSNDVFSFTTVDIIIDNFDDYDAASFELIYQPKPGEYGQSITAELSEESWIDADDQDMDNGKSMKISGSKLADWGYLQVVGDMTQIDVSSYDGIAFWMYPKNVSVGLGMIVHIANGYYPNDCMANMEIKGNAPTLVKIPFSALTLRAENTIGSFNPSYITGLWFTFKNASLLGFDQGFKGTLPDFEIYLDEFVPYKDSTIAEVTYEPAYYQTSLTIDFEEYADMDEVKDDCQEGVTDENSIISLSETGGYNDSKCLKFAAVTADNDTILKKFWNFTEYDYFEFFYNVPAGEANFFLRLYLNTSTDYSHRAYLDFSSVKLSGSGFLRVPITQEYLSVGGGAVAADIASANIKGLGFFVKLGSAEFYIDNIRLIKDEALPTAMELTDTATLRGAINTIPVGSGYRIVVEKAFSTGSHKALCPVVNSLFDVTAVGTTTLTAADLEDKVTTGNYVCTLYSSDGNILAHGTITIS